MFQRIFSVLCSLLLSIGVFAGWLWFLQQPKTAVSPTSHPLIINEWSQGNGSTREWVELLVTTASDLRGWDLGDSTPGDLVFSNDPLWANVAAGTLIVIYNGSDPDTILPSDDEDGGDCRLVLGHDNGRYFSGNWPAFSNSNLADNPHVRDANDITVHDFSQLPGNNLHPNAQNSVAFLGSSADTGTWEIRPASEATPGQGNGSDNSDWLTSLCVGSPQADLAVSKSGPAAAKPGDALVYTIQLHNQGQMTATAVLLTDTLPTSLINVTYSQSTMAIQPDVQTVVWEVEMLPPQATLTFQLTATVSLTASEPFTNQVTTTTSSEEQTAANNQATATTAVLLPQVGTVLIDAVLYDGYETADSDEAVALRNVTPNLIDLGGWQLRDKSGATAVLPLTATLAAGEQIWLANDGDAFRRQFGFAPHFATSSSDSAVAKLTGTWPGFANDGDLVRLLNGVEETIDLLVYGDETDSGWIGTAVQPYNVSNLFTDEGQILYRKRDQATGEVVADSDSAQDWAQELADPVNGRKIRHPGWDFDTYFQTLQVTETAVLTVALAPDNAYSTFIAQINAAQHSIQLAALTFEHIGIADALVAALNRGVAVTILLEGSPVGGLDDHERYVCQQIEAAGGACWFMIRDDAQQIQDRYRFQHAKYAIFDGVRAAVGSENLSPRSYPSDDKGDGTSGHRGVVLVTDAPTVVAHLQALFANDLDSVNHQDLFRWQAEHPTFGAPPNHFVPITVTGGSDYAVRYPTPLVTEGTFAFEVVQSPENSLRTVDGLLGLVNRAGANDVVLVQQLSERPFWGTTSSSPTADPNLRLEAYLAAARRGATVRLLLDSYFDDVEAPNSNLATCRYVQQVATQEQLDLDCQRANPTGLGIHNKMVLVNLQGQGYIHIGSINGTEQASKGNRELALQVQSNEAYALLAEAFSRDWPYRIFLPATHRTYRRQATHPLISEVLYDPSGLDDAEFIELVNPTGQTIDLSHYSVGDAVDHDDFEDVRRFPAGTMLEPHATLVVATSASAFQAIYGFAPDFEILRTETAVPTLADDPAWGDPATFLQLGNSGDEVILRDPNDNIVDIVVYGNSPYPMTLPCPLVTTNNHSLERFPYWRDSNKCQSDFRDWPFPNPNALPE